MNFLHLGSLLNLDWGDGLGTGSVDDMRARLKALLPAGWFPESSSFTGESTTPILDAVLTGPATALSWAYYLIRYAKDQTRLRTMSGGWLDLASYDFFNYDLLRLTNESDGAFYVRIIKEIFRERNTRRGISTIIEDITGRPPGLIEPWNPQDCGAYDQANVAGYAQALAYDAGGAYGDDPWTVYTYGASAGAGYGVQSMVYQVFANIFRPTDGRSYSDAMMVAALERVRAAGTVIWYRFSDVGTVLVTDAGDELVTDTGETLTVE